MREKIVEKSQSRKTRVSGELWKLRNNLKKREFNSKYLHIRVNYYM
jgi:hypothetical protein